MSDERAIRVTRKRQRTKSGQFMIYLDEDDRAQLDFASKRQRQPRSQILRSALRAYCRKLRQTEKIAS